MDNPLWTAQVVWKGVTLHAECARCDKPIDAISFHLIDGKSYCDDCVSSPAWASMLTENPNPIPSELQGYESF